MKHLPPSSSSSLLSPAPPAGGVSDCSCFRFSLDWGWRAAGGVDSLHISDVSLHPQSIVLNLILSPTAEIIFIKTDWWHRRAFSSPRGRYEIKRCLRDNAGCTHRRIYPGPEEFHMELTSVLLFQNQIWLLIKYWSKQHFLILFLLNFF